MLHKRRLDCGHNDEKARIEDREAGAVEPVISR